MREDRTLANLSVNNFVISLKLQLIKLIGLKLVISLGSTFLGIKQMEARLSLAMSSWFQ